MNYRSRGSIFQLGAADSAWRLHELLQVSGVLVGFQFMDYEVRGPISPGAIAGENSPVAGIIVRMGADIVNLGAIRSRPHADGEPVFIV